MRQPALDRQTARRRHFGPDGILLAAVLCSAILAMEPFALGAEPCAPERVADCLRRAIVRKRPGLPVLSPDEFARVAYPGLEVAEARGSGGAVIDPGASQRRSGSTSS